MLIRLRKGLFENVMQRRTRSQRPQSSFGVSLRRAALPPLTVKLYRNAFLALWHWMGRAPPKFVADAITYDKLLAEFIEFCWDSGLKSAWAGNSSCANITAFPEVRGLRALTDSWYLLSVWTRVETHNRAPPMPTVFCPGLIAYFVFLHDFEGVFFYYL